MLGLEENPLLYEFWVEVVPLRVELKEVEVEVVYPFILLLPLALIFGLLGYSNFGLVCVLELVFAFVALAPFTILLEYSCGNINFIQPHISRMGLN